MFEQAKDECENLMNAALPPAIRFLEQYGEFYPFFYTMSATGKINAGSASDGTEHPPSTLIIELLDKGLKGEAKAGKIKACAVVYDARLNYSELPGYNDAIAIDSIIATDIL